MKYSMRHLTIFLIVAVLSMIRLYAMPPEQKEDTLIASVQLRDGAILTVYSRDLALPSMVTQLRYALSTKPAAGGNTDTAFFVRYLPKHSTKGTIVWIGYRLVHVAAPYPAFSAALTSDPSDHAFMIFVESAALDVKFSVYKIDLSRHLGDAPPHLDPERREEWPKPPEPLSSVSYRLSNQDSLHVCTVHTVDAEWKDKAIVVQAQREPNGCESLLTSYDVTARTWTDVKPVDTAHSVR